MKLLMKRKSVCYSATYRCNDAALGVCVVVSIPDLPAKFFAAQRVLGLQQLRWKKKIYLYIHSYHKCYGAFFLNITFIIKEINSLIFCYNKKLFSHGEQK